MQAPVWPTDYKKLSELIQFWGTWGGKFYFANNLTIRAELKYGRRLEDTSDERVEVCKKSAYNQANSLRVKI